MLLKLRGGLNSFFVTALLGLLIAAFAVWGIGPGMLAGSNQSVATVGDTEIATNRYFNTVQQRAQSMQLQFGGAISTTQIIQAMQLDRQILSQMIVDAAIKEHISKLGLRASDAQLANELRSIEAFSNFDGSFSPQMMKQALSQAKISESELMDDLRTGVARRQLLESLMVDDMMPRALAENLYVWRAERRQASLINISASALTDIPAPTEDELTSFYDANKSNYMTPERRSYTYMMLTPEYFESQIEIPEGRLEEIYQQDIDTYSGSELRTVLQVNFNTSEKAEEFVAAVKSGADFIETAVASTDFAANEIDLGDNSREEMESVFGDETASLVFNLNVNEPSAPQEDISGFSVFMVPAITKIDERSFEDVKAEIEAEFRNEAAIDLLYDNQDKVSLALDDITSVSDIAENLGLPVATITDVDANGLGVDGNRIVTQQNEYAVQSAAFRAEIGYEPTITDLDPTDTAAGIFVFNLLDVKDPAQISFDDARAKLTSDLTAQRKQQRAGEIADQAAERLRRGEASELIAEELGGTSFDAKNVARTGGENTSISANIRNLIFDLGIGEVDSAASADNDGYVVVKVVSATPGNPITSDPAVNTLLDEVNASFQEELFTQYQAYLTSLYPAVVNEPLIRQLFSPDAQQ
jgi:hypothetical protein